MQSHPSATGGLDEPATVDLSGRCVGNSYILICPVGQGATGTVWRGIERTSGEQVAVKMLHEGLLRQPKLVTRFVQERTILMMVRHENIVGVRDLFSAGETLGLVMDFVSGGSLRERLRSEGTLAPAEAARLLAQVAAALAEAHALGVVHRDVKPDNILLQAGDGRVDVRLTDFGIARVVDAAGLTTPNAIIGTPHYMAPEVISGGEAGPATDVYALGMVLYELLSGRTPYAGEPIAVLRRHLDDAPHRPDGLPDRLWSVIEACVDKDPDRRPSTAELSGVLRVLARSTADDPALPAPADAPTFSPAGLAPAVSHVPGPRRAHPPRNRRRSWVWGRRPGAVAVLITGALLVAGLGGYRAWRWQDASGGHAAAAAAPGSAAALGPRAAPTGSAARGRAVTGGPPAGSPPPPMPASAPAGAAAAAGGGAPARARASAGPAGGPASAQPGQAGGEEEAAYGPWQCGEELSWDIGHPVLAQPCQSLGDTIRVTGRMRATPGVQADVSLSVLDVDSGDVAAGPYTCAGLMFTDFAPQHTCGPSDLSAPHGHRYVVVEDWDYTGRSLLPGGSTRGREFNW